MDQWGRQEANASLLRQKNNDKLEQLERALDRLATDLQGVQQDVAELKNDVEPAIKTFEAEQNRKLLFNEDGAPSARTKAIWAHTPMGRFGEAKELVGAAIFLASESASSFVTGTDIRVDGGFLAQTI